jgi:hypothetical protein
LTVACVPKKLHYLFYTKKFVSQSTTGLQIYEGDDDQLNRPGHPNHEIEYSLLMIKKEFHIDEKIPKCNKYLF